MLYSCTLLLLFAAISSAVVQDGYEDGKEYIYQISSQTLVSLNFETKHTSGIFIQARLALQPNGSDKLRAKIIQPQYMQIHTQLDNGVDTEINPGKLDLIEFPIGDRPFEIEVKDGKIKDLIVDPNLKTWELNFLKSIIGQLQVGTLDENTPTSGEDDTVIQKMEDSLSGRCQVLYNISAIPEHELQDVLNPMQMSRLNKDENILSLQKTRNYSNCELRVGYHFNINGRNKFEPGSTENGKFLSRSAISRMIITGGLQKYLIQSSTVTNRVTINPDQEGNQGGMLVGKIKLILTEVKDITDRFQPFGDAMSTGNLIYDTSNPLRNVRPRCIEDPNITSSPQNPKELDNFCNRIFYPRPKLSEAPKDSKIPYLFKDARRSNKTSTKLDIVLIVKEIAQSITNDLSQLCPGLDEQTLEKFATLIQLIRSMSAEEIFQVQHELFELFESQESGKNTWIIFRDAAAQAGTGPALLGVKRMIDEKQIRAEEAAFVVDAVAKSARTPTPEYMETYFEIAKTSKVNEDFAIHNAAIISFAELTRHAIVNGNSARNRYPVNSYGIFFKPTDKNVMDKYTKYMAQELTKSVDVANSRQIHVYIQALGRTADPRIMSIFEPYLKGERNITPFQRLSFALALDKFSEVKSKVAQPFLYALYANTSLPCDVRTALVYMLMKTKPPANMLHSMANNTHNDDCKQVNSAVKSSVESLAQTESHERGDLVDAAKSALPLLVPKSYGIFKSRAAFKDEKDSKSHTGSSIMAYDIGDDDGVLPKGATVVLNPTFEGLKLTKIKLETAMSSPKDFLEDLIKSSTEVKNEIFLNKTITKTDDQIEGAKRLEGYALIDYLPKNFFWTFDDDTLKMELPEYIRKLYKTLKGGENVGGNLKFTNYEVTLKFPTETGFPLIFRLEAPKFIRVKLNTSLNHDFHDRGGSGSSESLNLTAKLDVLYGSKFQKRLSFDTFFDRQEYVTGVDKNLQVRIPLHFDLQYYFKRNQTKITIQPLKEGQDYDIIQFKKQPFSTKRDLLDFEPINRDEKNHITDRHFVKSSVFDSKDGDQQSQLQFKWNIQTDKDAGNNESGTDDEKLDAARGLFKSVVAMVYPREFQILRYEEYSVKLHPTINVSAEIVITSDSLQRDDKNKPNESDGVSTIVQTSFKDRKLSKEERKQRMLVKVAENVSTAVANIVDVSLRLSNGGLSFDAVTAFSRNDVQKKSRALFYASAQTFDGGDYFFSTDAKVGHLDLPNMEGEETVKNYTQCEYDVEITFGIIDDDVEKSQKVTMHGEI